MNEMLSGDFPQPLVTCSNCGWSCRCTSDSLALEEAEAHEAQDPSAQIVFHHEVTS